MNTNALFKEYVTSGAFKFSLSRNQVSALAMIAGTGEVAATNHTCISLMRKGLAETIHSEETGVEFRLTEAGVFALKLVRMAELVNGSPDPVEEELAALRQQLNRARELLHQVKSDAWDMSARVQLADQKIAEARAWAYDKPAPMRPMVTMKNRNPERTQAQILAGLQAAENFLQMPVPEETG